MYVYLYIYADICVYMGIYQYVSRHIYIYIFAYICVYMYIFCTNTPAWKYNDNGLHSNDRFFDLI